ASAAHHPRHTPPVDSNFPLRPQPPTAQKPSKPSKTSPLYGRRWRTDHSYRTDIDTIACLAQSRVCMVVVRNFAQRGDRSQLGWRARVRPWASGKLSNDFMVLHGDVLLVDDVKRLGH